MSLDNPINPATVGIIGCGNISESYLSRASLFSGYRVVAVADQDMARAEDAAARHGLEAMPVDQLLSRDDIEIVINLTIPDAHFDVTSAILHAGKHAYSEKPLALSASDAADIAALAASRGLRVGCAPDTFLGGSHQASRALIDAGTVGTITHGTCHVMSDGMESWHPNPDFFFVKGGGPILDLGPYYVTQLVNLIGPVRRVAALSGMAKRTRTIGSGDRAGEEIPVETPTTVHALLEFDSGAQITLSASWDVIAQDHRNVELYGTEGTVYPQDPNFFGGVTEFVLSDGTAYQDAAASHPLAVDNRQMEDGSGRADYRGIGLSDMAVAIREGRPHRCAMDLARHVTEVLDAILTSGEEGRFVTIESTCVRPEPLDAAAAAALMRPDTVTA